MAPLRFRNLNTVDEIIDELGGTAVVARLTTTKERVRHMQHVSNWRAAGFFPSDTYLIITAALKERRCTASASLWRIAEPAAASA